MELDFGNLAAAVVVVLVVLASLLAFTWSQNRGATALGAWAVCFFLCAAAMLLLAARGRIPDFFALDVANVLRLLALGLGWRTARNFAGEKGSWALVLAPAGLWLAAGLLPGFLEHDRLRVIVSSLLVAALVFAVAAELWRGSARAPRIARPTAVVLAVHGAFAFARFVAALAGAEPVWQTLAATTMPIHPIVAFEALAVAVALAFLLLSTDKDVAGLQHRQAALADPLTGVANRRGFEAETRRMLARARRNATPTALMLLDLDHFKAVNDTWGHQFGDRMLQLTASAIAGTLRAGDPMGRLGGEEFAVMLPRCRIEEAALLAERIRRSVAAARLRHGAALAGVTVSIGVAAIDATGSPDRLFADADAALYRAKANGRNRVEVGVAAVSAASTPRELSSRPAARAA